MMDPKVLRERLALRVLVVVDVEKKGADEKWYSRKPLRI
jgi:hypothetical protein